MKDFLNETMIETIARVRNNYELSERHFREILKVLSQVEKIEIAHKIYHFDGDECGCEIDYIEKIDAMYKDGYELLKDLGLFENKIAYRASYTYGEGHLIGSSLKLLNESELNEELLEASFSEYGEELILKAFKSFYNHFYYNDEEEELLNKAEMRIKEVI